MSSPHKWRKRPPHPCQNPECAKLHDRAGRYCSACQKRLDRHGTLSIIEQPQRICITPACRSPVKAYGRCTRCHRLWTLGFNPDTYHRPYRRLCSVGWCPEYANIDSMCNKHKDRFRLHGDVRMTRGILEPIPTRCTWSACTAHIHARGLCLEHLIRKSKRVILLREFWPTLPGHKYRYCIGKLGCKRKAILFGRCPDCLYDWQFSLRPRRNFFKILH